MPPVSAGGDTRPSQEEPVRARGRPWAPGPLGELCTPGASVWMGLGEAAGSSEPRTGTGPPGRAGHGAPLPGGGGGTHQHVAQHEEPAFLGLDDLPPVVVNGFYHVVGPDEVSVSAAEELKSQPRVTRPPRPRPPGRGRGGTGLRGVGAARSRHCFTGAPRSPPRSPPAQFRQRLCPVSQFVTPNGERL